MTKIERYKAILTATEIQFNRGSCTNWRNKDFDNLSNEIWEKTRVLISSATLKRMFGKVQTKEDYYPQESTLDALILYANFTEKQLQLETTIEQHPKAINTTATNPTLPASNPASNRITWGWITIIAIVIAGIGSYLFTKKTANRTSATLNIVKKEGDVPATVFYNVAINAAVSDSVFFDKGDGSKLLYVPQTTNNLPVYYPYPGVYYTKLISGEKTISDTVTCIIPTKGWQGYAWYFDMAQHKNYLPIPITKNKQDSAFEVTNKYLDDNNLDTTKLMRSRLQQIRNTACNGNTFVAEAIFKNATNTENILCCVSTIEVDGTQGRITFSFANYGCSYYLSATISEKKLTIHDYDFSKLTTNLTEWQTVVVTNQAQHVGLQLNGKNVFEAAYTKSIGELTGVSITFNGLGQVKKLRVKPAQNGKAIFDY